MAGIIRTGPFRGLSHGQAFWYGIVPLGAMIGVVLAVLGGVRGWQGEGLAVGHGGGDMPGMLLGILGGLQLGLLIVGGLGVAQWASGNQTRTYVCVLLVFAYASWRSWSLSLFVFFAAMLLLDITVRKFRRHPARVPSCEPTQRGDKARGNSEEARSRDVGN